MIGDTKVDFIDLGHPKAIIFYSDLPIYRKNNPPKYAKIGGIGLRLIGNRRYWRDAGHWDINVRLKNGEFYVSSKNHPQLKHLHGEKVIEITEAQWGKSNEGYV